MSYYKIPAALFLLVFSLSFSASSHADNLIQFSIDGGSTFGDSFVIDTGSSVDAGVFLSETSPDTALSDDGLLGFGLTGTLASADAGVIAAASPDSVFDLLTTDEFTSTTINWESAAFSNAAPTGSSIALGSFGFDSIADGTSTLTFGDIQPGAGSANANWLTGAGAELDQNIFGSGSTGTFQVSISTSAVPEPSSVVLLGLASSLVFVRRRRKIA
jgi:hypothetical protein